MLGRAKVNKSRRLAAAFQEQRALIAQGARDVPALPHPDMLVLADFITEETSADKAKEAFDGMVNVEHIMEVVERLEATVNQAKSEGKTPASILENSHMIFTGPVRDHPYFALLAAYIYMYLYLTYFRFCLLLLSARNRQDYRRKALREGADEPGAAAQGRCHGHYW